MIEEKEEVEYEEIEELLKLTHYFEGGSPQIVYRACEYAKNLHKGQVRQSGEAYITHPIQVACILARMHADVDTLCAALLHDTMEDTYIKKEDIVKDFNITVSNLVDGVTKMKKINFSSKQEQDLANTRKIITGIIYDVRIIIIKLADRLHNMRTLQYKSVEKQRENALETMEIFVPLAYYIGANDIKDELEDLSLKYLEPQAYKKIEDKRHLLEENIDESLYEMSEKFGETLAQSRVRCEMSSDIKNIYGIYKNFCAGYKLWNIHDLIRFRILVNRLDECYETLGIVHRLYNPVNNEFKDYICNPQSNMYRSLHTTVFGPKDHLVQVQIRTLYMNDVATYGLAGYWTKRKDSIWNFGMQSDLKTESQFFKSLSDINEAYRDNEEFLFHVKRELFSEKIHVYPTNGKAIELPVGSTIADFAYKIDPDIGNIMIGALVNEKIVTTDYILNNEDRVIVLTNELAYGPKNELLESVNTSYAKRKIMEFNKKNY